MDKPYITFEQQVYKLRDEYDLYIPDIDYAINVMSSFSYYDLVNGYQDIYILNGKFLPNKSLDHLIATHLFNKNIQSILFKYSTYVENSFKTVLSNTIAHSFSENQNKYLQIQNYRKSREIPKREQLKKLLDKLNKICRECSDTPTSYYRLKKNHIPPWILFRNVFFSDATDLFSFLKRLEKEMFLEHQIYLGSKSLNFNAAIESTLTSLRLVRKFRNTIAHNLKFLTYRCKPLNKSANAFFVGSLISRSESDKSWGDVWGMVLSIVLLLNNKLLIQSFLQEFEVYMKGADPSIIDMYCDITGIPKDFSKRINDFLLHFDIS